ncbi:MAG: hypothetical protein ACRDYW_06350 [Acidimicrobiales bacterium]
MAIAVEREIDAAQPFATLGQLGWLAVAGGASLGAGAIHAAAIGVHSEHRQAVVAFTIVAAVQLAFGAMALARPGRLVLALGALANLGILGGWALAKVNGIGFVDGLDTKEAIQTADGLAAGLAVVAVVASLSAAARLGPSRLTGSPLLVGGTAVLVASLAVPGMLAAGSHAHDEGVTHGHEASAEPHDDGAEPAVVPPKPFDPALPIDLGGVPGVTPQQQAAAENLLAVTLLRLPRFADPAFAETNGFVSIGDGLLGHEHYLSLANMTDGHILDPDLPESLVYDTSVSPKRLVAAMFMLNPGDTLDDVPELGGKLTQWHVHDNLCFAGAQVAGLTRADGTCRPGTTKGQETPMIHVWIEPQPCGPFAALEGIAGGTIPEGETRLCDHAHGA